MCSYSYWNTITENSLPLHSTFDVQILEAPQWTIAYFCCRRLWNHISCHYKFQKHVVFMPTHACKIEWQSKNTSNNKWNFKIWMQQLLHSQITHAKRPPTPLCALLNCVNVFVDLLSCGLIMCVGSKVPVSHFHFHNNSSKSRLALLELIQSMPWI